jgi:hypothetical protein
MSDHARTTVSGGVTRSAVERLVRECAITQLLIDPLHSSLGMPGC